MGVLNLETHYSFYTAYHRHPTNVFIHMIFVWPILFSAFILLNYLPPLSPTPFSFLGAHFFLNASVLVAILYVLFYISLDAKAGSFAALLVLTCVALSQQCSTYLGPETAWKVATVVQLVSWIAQFLGHGVYEKRAPALIHNLPQAFLMAPFFVLLEALEKFGYEPHPGFKARVQVIVNQNLKELQSREKKQA